MADFTSVTGMIEDVLHRAGEVPTNASGPYYTKALEYLNRARFDLIKGISPLDPKSKINFKWAIKYPPDNFILQPMIDTGTVALTADSTTVTFSSAPASSVAGYRLILDDYDDIYRVVSHTGGNANATIDAAFTDDTDATADYKLVKIEYDLGSSDIIRLVSPLTLHRKTDNMIAPYKIYGYEESVFDEKYPLATISSGVPQAFKIVKVADNTITIVMSHYMKEDKAKVEYRVIEKQAVLTTSSTESDIKVPYDYRQVMCDWALAMLQKDKTDDKYKDSLALAQAGFKAMENDYKLAETNISPLFGRVISREDY